MLSRIEGNQRGFLLELDRDTLTFSYPTKSDDAVSYELTVIDRSGKESLPLSVTINE